MSDEIRTEYLVSHGKSGGFGRFVSALPMRFQRRDRVVIHSGRGLEIGTILRPAGDLQQLLDSTSVGEIVRPANEEDERRERRARQFSQGLYADARRLTRALDIDVEVLDVELLLDGKQAIVHYLAPGDDGCDAFAEALSQQCGIDVSMENLAAPKEPDEQHGGCGQPNCGRTSGKGCSSCGSGGCSSCGSGADLREYFAHVRGRMEEAYQRTPLL